jgi:hypothetical protein
VRHCPQQTLRFRLANVSFHADSHTVDVVQIESLRHTVVQTAKPKCLYGRPLTGAMLARLAVEYCNAMNDNQTPTIRNAWDRVAEQQCEQAVDKAFTKYKAVFTAGLVPPSAAASGAAGVVTLTGRFVVSTETLINLHNSALTQSKALFAQEAVSVCDCGAAEFCFHYAEHRAVVEVVGKCVCICVIVMVIVLVVVAEITMSSRPLY